MCGYTGAARSGPSCYLWACVAHPFSHKRQAPDAVKASQSLASCSSFIILVKLPGSCLLYYLDWSHRSWYHRQNLCLLCECRFAVSWFLKGRTDSVFSSTTWIGRMPACR